MNSIHDLILDLLKSNNIEFKYLEHEEVKTSEESAKIRDTKLEQGAKALILKGKKSGNNIMVVLPAHKKANIEKIEQILSEKFEFESPDNILKKWGIQVGGVPPFGNLLNLPTYIDKEVLNNDIVVFNCGTRTSSIFMNPKDMVELIKGELGEYSL